MAILVPRLGGDQATREWVQRVAALPVKEAIETLFTALCDTQRPHVVIEANAMTLCGVVLKSLPLNDTVFRGSDMRHCVLDGAQLMRADLREVDAAGASFCKAQMSNCDGRGGIFDRAIFDEACMIRTVFDGASLQDARFDGVVMQQASFHYATLTDSFYHRRITPPVHHSESSGAVGAGYAPRHRMIQGAGQPTPAMPMGPRDGFQRPLIRYGPCPPTPPPTRQASPLETISE